MAGLTWPDWTGRAVAIIASGPSAKSAGVHLLKGRMPVLAIKANVDLAPWADVVYGCDFPWWRSVQGLPKFGGLKLTYDTKGVDEYGLGRVFIPDHAKSNALLFGETGVVGGGGNSGFQALNLAVQFGAARIILIGFDMHGRGGFHWYGRNNAFQMSNPTEDNYRRWRMAFASAAPVLTERGIDVVNASDVSDLQGYRRLAVEAALREWEL